MKKLSFLVIFATCWFFVSCGNDDTVANQPPEVIKPISDFSINASFEIIEIDLATVFSDPEGDELSYTTSSDDETVVTSSVVAENLNIIEVGLGQSTVTVTATDPAGGSATDTFVITVQ